MNNGFIQLIVLAGIAIFLILRLKSVLGTKDGFEKPTVPLAGPDAPAARNRPEFEVIDGGVDHDIADYAETGSDNANALAQMKGADRTFKVGEFLGGAKGAYEMILMGFEQGELDQIKPFLSDDVYQSFIDVVAAREDQGLTVEAHFVGVREIVLQEATFDPETEIAEVTVKFVGELTSVVRNQQGEIVEGDANQIKRQRDIWTFSRKMGTGDPNWQLVATGE